MYYIILFKNILIFTNWHSDCINYSRQGGHMAESDRRQGESHGATGRYDPPDGAGFADLAIQALFGQSQADKDYHEGHEKGSQDRKNR